MPADTVIDAVAALCEAFRRTASEVTIAAYEVGLRGLTDAQISAATGMALQRFRYMPAPCELRELAITGGKGYERMAQEAFVVADKAARLNRGRRISFDDAIITATVRMLGGLQAIPKQGTDAATFYRKEFIETYRRLAVSGISPEHAEPLPAIIDHESAQPDCAHIGARPEALLAVPRESIGRSRDKGVAAIGVTRHTGG